MSLAILFRFLCAQHDSEINMSIIRSLRLFCWITTLVVLFLARNSNTHRAKNNTINVVIQQNSRKLLMMDILMSETCWAHKKWNKTASDIKVDFYSSTITMMRGPINIRYFNQLVSIVANLSVLPSYSYRHFRFKSWNGPTILVQNLNGLPWDKFLWL